jgi:hypothetical protein
MKLHERKAKSEPPPVIRSTALCADSFAYSTIEEYEELVGCRVNEAFRTGWMMARTMNSHIAALRANEKADRSGGQ